jgi:hypothetical protein
LFKHTVTKYNNFTLKEAGTSFFLLKRLRVRSAWRVVPGITKDGIGHRVSGLGERQKKEKR